MGCRAEEPRTRGPRCCPLREGFWPSIWLARRATVARCNRGFRGGYVTGAELGFSGDLAFVILGQSMRRLTYN